jgi:transcriptional regulator with XRE-family HTH domain
LPDADLVADLEASVAVTFGEWLRRVRLAARLTVRDVARAAGVSPAYVSDVENGHRAPPGEESLFGYHGLARLLFARGAVAARDADAAYDRIIRRVRAERAVFVAGTPWRRRRNTLKRQERKAL